MITFVVRRWEFRTRLIGSCYLLVAELSCSEVFFIRYLPFGDDFKILWS